MSSSIKKGICSNLPSNCDKARSREEQTAPASNFICSNPECGWALREIIPRRQKNYGIAFAGIGLAIALGGSGYAAYKFWPSGQKTIACPSDTLNEFLAQSPKPEQLLEAAKSCLAEAKSASDIGTAARLCRHAADAGKPEGALCLGELYDPQDAKPGRAGQMPAADFTVAFDNYRRAKGLGSTEADAKLTALKPFVESKAAEGDRAARDVLDRWPN